MGRKSITISYLEFLDGQEIQGTVTHCRLAYRTTGSALRGLVPGREKEGFWIDKLNWSEEEWRNHGQHDTLQTWGAWQGQRRESPLGFSGCGLGKKLLLEALIKGLKLQPRSPGSASQLQGPGHNYRDNGKIFPELTPSFWPG